MTEILGHLLWWKVGETDLDHDQLKDLKEVTLPARPLPIDVYRRITGTANLRRDLGDGDHYLEVTLSPVDTKSDKMLTHHIVGHMKTHTGQPVRVKKVGDVAYYKPPRGQNSRARMRVAVATDEPTWQPAVQEFGELLRHEYDRGVKGALDGQAIRRLVRAHLVKYGALYLDGPYFVKDENLQPATSLLTPLFGKLGDGSFMMSVPLPNYEEYRQFVVRGLERAVKQGVEIDETIWKVVEQ